ncbi:unnamed protein product [Lactuca saligna]|uniref:Uncharacterized protein n=1 Tax=Lactuca saligna TaxID=75948 RepID=A0AA35YFD4_LACSI|nr:unnamed protein product [Lactuca saligna]
MRLMVGLVAPGLLLEEEGLGDNKWKWIEDNEGCFTMASCRKTIDNHLLICLEDNTHWNKILPETESHLFLNCLVAREVCVAIINGWNQVPVDSSSLHDLFGCVSSSGTPRCVSKMVGLKLPSEGMLTSVTSMLAATQRRVKPRRGKYLVLDELANRRWKLKLSRF